MITAVPEALKFVNRLSGRLHVELTAPPERIGPLENLRAVPNASVVQVTLAASVFEREAGTFRPLTEQELDLVVFHGPQVAIRGEGGPVTFDAPNGSSFTVRDLLAAVEETERRTRSQSGWFGGIDVHHVFFEGIHLDESGAWQIHWGS